MKGSTLCLRSLCPSADTLLSVHWYLRQGDVRDKVSLLLSEKSAIAGEGNGRKDLATFYHLFWTHLFETQCCSLLTQKILFGLAVMAQLKPICSTDSNYV